MCVYLDKCQMIRMGPKLLDFTSFSNYLDVFIMFRFLYGKDDIWIIVE